MFKVTKYFAWNLCNYKFFAHSEDAHKQAEVPLPDISRYLERELWNMDTVQEGI
jgi:hypothetical protein